MGAEIKLKRERLAEYRQLSGMTTQQKLGDAMGMERSTLSRTLNGFIDPGEKLIAGLVRAFVGTTVLDVSPARLELAAEMVGLSADELRIGVLFTNLFDLVGVGIEDVAA
ncbi:helix-turn-helix domain-containing protein [Rhodococcus sp. UNC363MFTsu5.1]|uniref:helix-turn-helix domain-containing protein n=1 Tax=Rhodococcus sp. UNC363MFTsu5.1 TaxID=1449069 RepID=UPI000484A3D6|nr:helix-turn-helix transcriptional regulator [Rhodococcus sp. UNC363MFTsu5.1]